jgi:DNA polymerase V
VKALGVAMGTPWFHMKDLAKRHGIIAMSSNYELYGDMSRRFHALVGAWGAQEIYSIDESWLDFTDQPTADLTTTGHAVRTRVGQWLGLPISAGFGATKTLAKLANRCAKKQERWQGVCDLTSITEAELVALMGDIEVRDVWGIGRNIAMQLMEYGVRTVAELRACDARRVRERWGVVMERTVRELQGTACIEMEDEPPAKKQIVASRSFGSPLYTLEQLAEPVRFHMGRAAEKLRQQGGTAGRIGVFLETNRFRDQDAQYSPSKSIPLPADTADTATLTQWATSVLRAIYKPGFRYVKAGCMLMELGDRGVVQGSLFDAPPPARDVRREKLMGVLDKANNKWGRGTMGIGSAGVKQQRGWSMLRENLSPAYTTRWDELCAVRS